MRWNCFFWTKERTKRMVREQQQQKSTDDPITYKRITHGVVEKGVIRSALQMDFFSSITVVSVNSKVSKKMTCRAFFEISVHLWPWLLGIENWAFLFKIMCVVYCFWRSVLCAHSGRVECGTDGRGEKPSSTWLLCVHQNTMSKKKQTQFWIKMPNFGQVSPLTHATSGSVFFSVGWGHHSLPSPPSTKSRTHQLMEI